MICLSSSPFPASENKVDVPLPMHIGVPETEGAGPGDCHIKGGYVFGSETFTVKMANVSFYKNLDKGIPPGSGIFVVISAVTGAPLGVFQENRYMTDLRTGAAGAISVKYCTNELHDTVSFIGTGAIAKSMASATNHVKKFKHGYAFGLGAEQNEEFAQFCKNELGYECTICDTAEEAVNKGDVVFTQTTGASTVLEKSWLKPHATIIASGTDQPTKQEIPSDVQAESKMVCDLVRQCERVGELRSAIRDGTMTRDNVYAELGEIVGGAKSGRDGGELILVDLTGTGAQDAAIGQVAWDILGSSN